MNTIEITKTLYDIFNALNEHYWGNTLPEPFITIVQGVTKRKSIMGAYAGETYIKTDEDEESPEELRHEIMISGEFIHDDIYDLCDTMEHEMCHMYAKINNIKDTSGKKHTKKFKRIAEDHGLVIPDYNEKNGWNDTCPTNEFKAFVDTLNINPETLEFFRNTVLPPSKPSPKKRFICPVCGLQVQAKKKTLIKCAEHDLLMDYWDLTDPEAPMIIQDFNEGLAMSEEGWFYSYLNYLENMEVTDDGE